MCYVLFLIRIRPKKALARDPVNEVIRSPFLKRKPDTFRFKVEKIHLKNFRYYKSLAIVIGFVIPTIVPMLLWNETFVNAYFVPAIFRYVFTLHMTWLVNSVAHCWGWKKYDKRINPVENVLVSLGAHGEGFHNYHHTFPHDYATSEYGSVYFNLTKGFIDFMALFGQAYDRRKISEEQVMQRRKRTGDLSGLSDDESRAQELSQAQHEHDF